MCLNPIPNGWVATVVLSLILLGCTPNSVGGIGLPTQTMEVHSSNEAASASQSEAAREKILAYLRDTDPTIPPQNSIWEEENLSAEKAVAFHHYLYSFQSWTVSVVVPLIAAEQRVFTVIVLNNPGDFQWAGFIDARGNIQQMNILAHVSPTSTATPLPTVPTLPTATLNSTITPTSAPCNDATFIDDVTIPDGSAFPPGTRFLKVWRLRNVGSCTWTPDYELVFVGGSRLGAESTVPLAETVKPGESVDLGVYMVSPRIPGDYRGFWMLQNANGKRFGIGDEADDSFWVNITVVGLTTGYKYDFALNYCEAIWRSETSRLTCGDVSTPGDGSVHFLTYPELENRSENEQTLWVHPNEEVHGWIEGSYPPVSIKAGDSFKAWVGCMAGYDLCDVTFYLAYKGRDDHIYILRSWREVLDGRVTMIDLDLSNLAGQDVEFILGMEANSSNVISAQGFWFVPRIEE